MQTEAEIEREDRKQKSLRWAFRKQKQQKMKRARQQRALHSVLSRSSKCHFSYQARDKMSSRLKNGDQYAGHRTTEERKKVLETVHCVYCSNSPLPLSDHNTNDVVSSRMIHHTLTASLTAFLQREKNDTSSR